jgi:hypothetical protein
MKMGASMKTEAGVQPGAGMKPVAGVQQFPGGGVLSGTPKPSRHVPELFEDCLTAVAETKIVFFY